MRTILHIKTGHELGEVVRGEEWEVMGTGGGRGVKLENVVEKLRLFFVSFLLIFDILNHMG